MTKRSKLVRDKIPEIIKGNGESPITHKADDVEYWQKLLEKLSEEVDEFRRDQNEGEIADILEVIEAIAEHRGFVWEDIKKIKAKKARERGGFEERIILDDV